jgi:hypothetical protein
MGWKDVTPADNDIVFKRYKVAEVVCDYVPIEGEPLFQWRRLEKREITFLACN